MGRRQQRAGTRRRRDNKPTAGACRECLQQLVLKRLGVLSSLLVLRTAHVDRLQAQLIAATPRLQRPVCTSGSSKSSKHCSNRIISKRLCAARARSSSGRTARAPLRVSLLRGQQRAIGHARPPADTVKPLSADACQQQPAAAVGAAAGGVQQQRASAPRADRIIRRLVRTDGGQQQRCWCLTC